MRSRFLMAAALGLAALVAACSSGGGASAPASVAPVSQAPASVAPASQAPASQPAASAGAVTVDAKPVGSVGTVLVAGSNGMTLYIFAKDVKDSGKSVCTGQCLTTWPALTVAAGATPTGSSGVTGKFGTIVREDDGTTQVTYNGLPLYFFANDKAVGDANGVYQDWEVVKP